MNPPSVSPILVDELVPSEAELAARHAGFMSAIEAAAVLMPEKPHAKHFGSNAPRRGDKARKITRRISAKSRRRNRGVA